MKPMLKAKGLYSSFIKKHGRVSVLHGIDFSLNTGEAVGIVGESGSGKSVFLLSLLGLLPHYKGQVDSGEVWIHGSHVSKSVLSKFGVGIIAQDPLSSLNPFKKIGAQIPTQLLGNGPMNSTSSYLKKILGLIGLHEDVLKSYPYQLSGGMRQRVTIAKAISGNPQLLMADEPTTGLDVLTKRMVMQMLVDLRNEKPSMSLVIASHDLSMIEILCDRIVVFFRGRILEEGKTAEIMENPKHPYTQDLLTSYRGLQQGSRVEIENQKIGNFAVLEGCSFQENCAYRKKQCKTAVPELKFSGNQHGVACFHVMGG